MRRHGSAYRVRALGAVVLGTVLTACTTVEPTGSNPGGNSPGNDLPISPAPFVVNGIVSGNGVPLGGATVDVRTPFLGWFVKTDASGRYSAEVSGPAPTVWITAHHAEFLLQPCAVWFEPASNTTTATRDVALLSAGSAPASFPNPGPDRRRVSGTVYTNSDGGKQPAPNVYVAWDLSNDDWKATTQTDASGRFTLCDLPVGRTQIVAYDGHQGAWSLAEPGGDAEIELTLEKF